MKKFLFIAALVMIGSYVSAQTNTENDQAFSGQTFRMQCIGNHLAYNGVRLTDNNKTLLLGNQIAEQYDKARKQSVMGDAFIISGSALTALGVLAVLAEYNLGNTEDDPDQNVPESVHNALKIGGYVVGGIGIAMLPVGIAFRVKGVKAMDKIADDFNQQHGVAMIKVSPSVMTCSGPAMHNQCVVGATMSLSF